MSNANVGKVFNMTGGNGGGGALKLETLTITRQPNTTTYKSGERFDPEGMVVTAGYGYGLTSDVTGYTWSPQVLTDRVTEVVISYNEGRVTKTASVPVTVKKVLVSIAVTEEPTNKTYQYLETFDPGDMVVAATYSDESSEPVSGYTYPEDGFRKLGPQSVEIGYTYEGVRKTTTLQVTVNAIEVAAPVQNGALTYDGSPKTPSWTGYDTGKMSISGQTEGVNAGDYTAKFTLNYGYQFPNETDEVSVKWTIGRAVIEAVPTQSNVLAANGTPQSPTWDGYEPDKMTISGERTGTEAREYTATFTPDSNHQWWDGSTEAKNAVWVITSVLVTIPTQRGTPIYDGSPKTPEWDNFDQVNSSVEVTPATEAGTHQATFTLLNGMWSDGSTGKKTVNWTIGRASIAAAPQQSGVPKYDGNPKTPTWDSNYDSSKMTVSVEAQVNAGTGYTASFTPDSNHQWWDGETGAKTATWAIEKGDQVVTVSPGQVTLNTGARTAKFTVTRKGDGVISAVSNNLGVATIREVNQVTGEVTVNSVNDTTGDTTITVKVAAGANYAAGADKTVTVKAQFVTIYGVEWDWTSGSSTKGKRTDGSALFAEPSPAVNNGAGSSPFDNLYPWKDMTKSTRTGGVMVKEPKYWYKWTKTGKKLKLQIADGPVEGFHPDPVNMDRGDGLGELDYSFIARYHCASGTYKSETNKAQQVSITRSTARTNIHNLGANIWQVDFAQMWYVGMLFLVEFADWNGERIGRGCSASGSKENNGKTDAMGYHTGTTAANRDSYGFTQYRNIEGWWDNVYDWLDGCCYTASGLNVIKNPAQFSDSANGILVGLPVGGWPKDFAIPAQAGFEWALYPCEAGGSATTYVPDSWYFRGGNPCLGHGGSYYQSQNRGPFCVDYSSASSTSGDIGCRLQERPPKAA